MRNACNASICSLRNAFDGLPGMRTVSTISNYRSSIFGCETVFFVQKVTDPRINTGCLILSHAPVSRFSVDLHKTKELENTLSHENTLKFMVSLRERKSFIYFVSQGGRVIQSKVECKSRNNGRGEGRYSENSLWIIF